MAYLVRNITLAFACFLMLNIPLKANFIPCEGQVQFVGIETDLLELPRFVFKGKQYDVYFFSHHISYVLKQSKPVSKDKGIQTELSTKLFRFDMEFKNPTGEIEIAVRDEQKIRNHYITGKQNVWLESSFGELVYQDVRPGMDIKFYEEDGLLEHDIIIHEGADLSQLAFQFTGQENLKVDDNKLVLGTPLGNFETYLPVTFQMNGELKEYKKSAFVVTGNTVQFEVGDLDPNNRLTIDPWSTFVGGIDIDECYSVATDNNNNTYICGYTGSLNFPVTSGSLQTVKQGLYDAFVTKLDTTGNEIWSTFYGGAGDETAYAIAVDQMDNPYLMGYTNGNDILVSSSGVFQSMSNGSYDAFIVKLDSAGNFIWGTYFGGSGGEFALAGEVDNSNNVVIAGYTSSTDLPVQNAFQGTMAGALDAFTAKFDSTGNLLWSTYFGGMNTEDAHGMHIDNQNNVIVTGETFSNNFPTSTGAYQSLIAGNKDIFIIKFDSLGNRVFSTYFGGSVAEDGLAITSDNQLNFYLVGYTESLDFPIIGTGIYQAFKNTDKDGFIVKFSPLGVPLKSTFLGGSAEDRLTTATYSSTGAIYVAGYSNSTDLSLVGTPYQSANYGLFDGFYYKLDANLNPNYSTYIGGNSADYLRDVIINNQNQVLTFSGFSASQDFPTTLNVFQDTLAGQFDAFVFQSDSTTIITSFKPSVFGQNEIRVYPTLFHDAIYVDLSAYQLINAKVYLYDELGRLVYSVQTNESNLSLQPSQLKPGVYLLKTVVNSSIIKTKKLIKY